MVRGRAASVLLASVLAGCGSGHGATAVGSPGEGTSGATHATVADVPADAAPSAGADASSASTPPSSAEGDPGFRAPTGPQAQQATQRFAEGAAAFQRGDIPAAATAFRAAYELAPSMDMAFNLGRVYERMGEVDDGVRYFEIVLRAHPSPEIRTDVEHRIAGLRAYEQRRREGIAQPPPSTDELSAEGARWFTSGVTMFRRHEYSQALLAFQQAYQYLQTPELLFNLAAAHEHLRHYDQAIEFLREYQQQRRGTAEEQQVERHIHELEARQ